jgi:hypothetical protein
MVVVGGWLLRLFVKLKSVVIDPACDEPVVGRAKPGPAGLAGTTRFLSER